MSDKKSKQHYTCLSKEITYSNPLINFPDLESSQEDYTNFEQVETLCGRKEMRLLCLSLDHYKMFVDNQLASALCPKCLENPDLALYLLSQV